jgi:hypothetical protein
MGLSTKIFLLPQPKVTVTLKVTVTYALDEESAKILKTIKGML